jgi:hypothetical protein
MSYTAWLYVYANPVNLTDPSGKDPWWCEEQSNPDLCRAKWTIDHGGRLTAEIIETLLWGYPDEILRLLQQQFKIKLPDGYTFRYTIGGSAFDDLEGALGVNWWFSEYIPLTGDILEISEYSCALLSTDTLDQAKHIDYSIYITKRAFTDWDYKPDDIAGIMIHEAVHAWQENTTRNYIMAPGQPGDPSSLSWFYTYSNGIERQAVKYMLDADSTGRINMSNGLWLLSYLYKLDNAGGKDFPYLLPPNVP